jgi:hypothetical protein
LGEPFGSGPKDRITAKLENYLVTVEWLIEAGPHG